MRCLTILLAPVLALVLAACAMVPAPAGWQARLRGDTIALLGEVHDNAEQHRLRLAALERAVAAGWRPAIVMEQFDRERQSEIERARRERPRDAQHVIDLAAPGASGWDWSLYRPVVAFALANDLPLIAGNLSNAEAARIVRGGYAAVFDPATIAALGLDRPIDARLEAAQEREIDDGHCHALPPAAWPRMARAQLARDAVMAAALRRHAEGGAVLLAGNGHVRRDIGVPRWLGPDAGRALSIGFLEDGGATPTTAFDAVVRTAAEARSDPCERFVQPSRRVNAASSHSPVASSWRTT